MTDSQKIERLATEVMGWTEPMRDPLGRLIMWGYPSPDGTVYIDQKDWNPLTDWNHAVQVLAKMKKRDIPDFGFADKDAQMKICAAALDSLENV